MLHIHIIGLGLIGASLAAALKAAGKGYSISAYNRKVAGLEFAKSKGLIDLIAKAPTDYVAQSDIVLLAAPLSSFPHLFETLADVMEMGQIITDAGSVKGSVIDHFQRSALAKKGVIFIPAHPIAGKESSGTESFDARLYQGKKTIVTPFDDQEEALKIVQTMWHDAGATIELQNAQTHDTLFAMLSHLPQKLAFDMQEQWQLSEDYGALKTLLGAHPVMRLFSSPKPMWDDIFEANKDALALVMEQFKAKVVELGALPPEAYQEQLTLARSKVTPVEIPDVPEALVSYCNYASFIATALVLSASHTEQAGSGWRDFTRWCLFDSVAVKI